MSEHESRKLRQFIDDVVTCMERVARSVSSSLEVEKLCATWTADRIGEVVDEEVLQFIEHTSGRSLRRQGSRGR